MSGDTSDHQPKRVAIAGASGTIGRAVVRQLIDEGHAVLALLREGAEVPEDWQGGEVAVVDLGDAAEVSALLKAHECDTVISCIASRSGAPKDAKAVDYGLNHSLLKAAEASGVAHFTLLSAICVQKPRLAFQHAKLAFENELIASDLNYTIVRPTAFFKSLSGQVERVAKGARFMVFGDGQLTRCNPISDGDLARYIAQTLNDTSMRNCVLPIGGPGPAISPMDQRQMLTDLLGKEVGVRHVPLAMLRVFERVFALGASVSDWCAAKAEHARIAQYYASESMLVIDPDTGAYDADATPEFGSETLRDHYAQLIVDAKVAS